MANHTTPKSETTEISAIQSEIGLARWFSAVRGANARDYAASEIALRDARASLHAAELRMRAARSALARAFAPASADVVSFRSVA